MRHLIQMCRGKFGDPPRKFALWDRSQLYSKPPRWMPKNDALLRIFADQDELLLRGRVVWGALVQANALLFEPGSMDHPADIVYGVGAGWDDRPDVVAMVASEIGDLKGTEPDHPDLQWIAWHTTNEMDRALKTPLPPRLSRGSEMYLATIVIQRKHLPHGYLTGGLFPLIINPEETPCAMILPARYWPSELVSLAI